MTKAVMKTLYHGTSSSNLSSIKAIGLDPGHAKGGDAWAKEHHWSLADVLRAPSVYVTDGIVEAEDFARTAVEEMGGDPIIITLSVPQNVFETFTVDEMFEGHNRAPHAWRTSHIDAKYIDDIKTIKPGPSPFTLMENPLIQALAALMHHR